MSRIEFEECDLGKTELDGPYECSGCGGHLMIDATFLLQVSEEITCPYCEQQGIVKGE